MVDDKHLRSPAVQTGYSGDEEPSRPQPGPRIRTEGLSAKKNRGRRAPQEGSGAVIGSGAAAGGGGSENFDSAPQAGDGHFDMTHEDPNPTGGADAPVGGSR